MPEERELHGRPEVTSGPVPPGAITGMLVRGKRGYFPEPSEEEEKQDGGLTMAQAIGVMLRSHLSVGVRVVLTKDHVGAETV